MNGQGLAPPLKQVEHQALRSHLLPRAHPTRNAWEQRIVRKYQRAFGAQLDSFHPWLLGMTDDRDQAIASAGFDFASEQHRLFVEQYLPTDVATAVSRASGHRCARNTIVEIGQLAAFRNNSAPPLFLALAVHLQQREQVWTVVAATRPLHLLFRRLRIPTLTLAAADPRRLDDPGAEWGRYYDTSPRVLAIRLKEVEERLCSRLGAAAAEIQSQARRLGTRQEAPLETTRGFRR